MSPDELNIQELAMDLFNATVPIGSPVIYINDVGERENVTTRSEAWALGHGEAVVKIKGRAGGVALSRIRVPLASISRGTA